MTLIEVGFESRLSRIGDSSSEAYWYMADELTRGLDKHPKKYEYEKEVVLLLKSYFHNLRNNWDPQLLARDFDTRPDVFNLFTDELEAGMCIALDEAALLGQYDNLEGLLAAQSERTEVA